MVIITENEANMDNQLTTIETEPAPNYEPIKALVLDGLDSPYSKAMYGLAIEDFINWLQVTGVSGLTKATVNHYKSYLLSSTDYAPSTINLRLSAIRKLAREADDNKLIDDPLLLLPGVGKVENVKSSGVRSGNWLTKAQAQKLINSPDITRLKGIRDRAILAVLIGGGLRRSEAANLKIEDIQQRDGRWVIVDLIGKRKRVRTVPLPTWAIQAINEWTEAANIQEGNLFRPVNKGERITGDSITSQTVQDVVKEYAGKCGFSIAAHDLRRTFAKLARKGDAPIDQIQLTLGHASVATTERYLGTSQDLTTAPCDVLGLRLG